MKFIKYTVFCSLFVKFTLSEGIVFSEHVKFFAPAVKSWHFTNSNISALSTQNCHNGKPSTTKNNFNALLCLFNQIQGHYWLGVSYPPEYPSQQEMAWPIALSVTEQILFLIHEGWIWMLSLWHQSPTHVHWFIVMASEPWQGSFSLELLPRKARWCVI